MVASAPAITGSISGGMGGSFTASGAFSRVGDDLLNRFGGDSSWNNLQYSTFSAARCSSIYGASGTIRPISKEVRFMLRY